MQAQTKYTEPNDPPLSPNLLKEHRSRKLGTERHLRQVKNHYLQSSNPDDSLIDPTDSPALTQLDHSLQLRKLSGAGRDYIYHRAGEEASDNGSTLNSRARNTYRQVFDLDRTMRENHGAEVCMALLTFRLSPESPDGGGLVEPLTLLDQLADGLNPALQELRRLLRYHDVGYEYIKVVTGTEYFATPHCHLLIYMNDHPPRSVFTKTMEKFVEKCPAPTPGHAVPDPIPTEGACVTLRSGDEIEYTSDVSTGARYVARQIPHITPVDELQSDDLETYSRAQFGAIAYATNRKLTYCSEPDTSPEPEPKPKAKTDTVGLAKNHCSCQSYPDSEPPQIAPLTIPESPGVELRQAVARLSQAPIEGIG